MKKFNIADWQKKHLLNESRLNEVDSETTVKYTDDNGKDHEIKYGSAMKYDDKHPAKIAALSMTDTDSGSDKEAGQEKEPTGKLSGTDFERGGEDDSKTSTLDTRFEYDDSGKAEFETEVGDYVAYSDSPLNDIEKADAEWPMTSDQHENELDPDEWGEDEIAQMKTPNFPHEFTLRSLEADMKDGDGENAYFADEVLADIEKDPTNPHIRNTRLALLKLIKANPDYNWDNLEDYSKEEMMNTLKGSKNESKKPKADFTTMFETFSKKNK